MATTAGRPDDFLFPTGPGTQRTKAESAEMFRMVLDAAGFQTRFVDERRAPVTAAPALALTDGPGKADRWTAAWGRQGAGRGDPGG